MVPVVNHLGKGGEKGQDGVCGQEGRWSDDDVCSQDIVLGNQYGAVP